MRDRQQISREAAALLESCGIRKIPVPLKPISKRLGVTVHRAKFDDRDLCIGRKLTAPPGFPPLVAWPRVEGSGSPSRRCGGR